MLRRTTLQRRTKLTARKPLNKISVRRVKELNAQAPIREALCWRAGGKPFHLPRKVTIDGQGYDIDTVLCLGGTCECGCKQQSDILEPHELKTRGSGGKLSLQNSIMVRHDCHRRIQKSNPMWSTLPGVNTASSNQQGEVLPNGQ